MSRFASRPARFFACSLSLILALFIAACAPQEPAPLPTLIPTATVAPSTNTPWPTSTPRPTITPTPRINAEVAENPAEQAYIRIVNAVPGDTAFDLYLDDVAISGFIGFGQYSGRRGVVAGDYTLQIVTAGQRPPDGILLEDTLSVSGQQSLILVIEGTPDAPAVQVLQENTEPLAADRSRVTLYNTVEALAGLRVQHNNVDLISNLGYEQMTNPASLETGQAQFALLQNDEAVYSHNTTLRPRESYALLLMGNDPSDLRVLEISAQVSGLVNVQAVNLVQGIDAIDMYLNDTLLRGEMTYGVVTPSRTILDGVYEIRLYASGADPATTQPLASAQRILSADDTVNLIAIGSDDQTLIVNHVIDQQPTPPDQARVTFINALADVPRVEMNTDATQSVSLIFGEISGPVTFNTRDTYSLVWEAVEDGITTETLETVEAFQPEAGTDYLYIFTGSGRDNYFLVGNPVGVNEEAEEGFVVATATAVPPSRIRAVSAIDAFPVEFRIDDIVFANSVTFGAGSPAVITQAGERVLTVHRGDTGALLERSILTIEPDKRYSVFASGNPIYGYNLYLAEDDPVQNLDNLVSYRFVNLTQWNGALSLGTSRGREGGPPPTSSAPTPEDNPNINDETAVDTDRRSLFFGVIQHIERVPADTISAMQPIYNESGLRDFHIIETETADILHTLYSVQVEQAQHYDIVMALDAEENLIGFVLQYPD